MMDSFPRELGLIDAKGEETLSYTRLPGQKTMFR